MNCLANTDFVFVRDFLEVTVELDEFSLTCAADFEVFGGRRVGVCTGAIAIKLAVSPGANYGPWQGRDIGRCTPKRLIENTSQQGQWSMVGRVIKPKFDVLIRGKSGAEFTLYPTIRGPS